MPAALDTPEDKDEDDVSDGKVEKKREEVVSKGASPFGAAAAPSAPLAILEKDRVFGGLTGPIGSKIVQLGGAGDCGWRCMAVGIAAKNAKQSSKEEIYPKAEVLGRPLRKLVATYLCKTVTSWKESWSPDPDASVLEEGLRQR